MEILFRHAVLRWVFEETHFRHQPDSGLWDKLKKSRYRFFICGAPLTYGNISRTKIYTGNGMGAMQGFSLVMELREPDKLRELMGKIAQVRKGINAALASLDYVHSSRFVPIPEKGLLLIVTEFDGEMSDYVLDFAVVLDEEFSLILSYMKGCPPLPVSQYPNEFWAYVRDNQAPPEKLKDMAPLFSPYKDKSVLDIVELGRTKQLPARVGVPAAQVETSAVQANLLQGYGAQRALHLCFHAPTTTAAQAFVKALLEDPVLRPTCQAERGERALCVNIGWTHAGLQMLGLPAAALQQFPQAFREGAARRAERVGDTDAGHWHVGGAGDHDLAHGLVSLQVKTLGQAGELDGHARTLRALMERHRVQIIKEQAACALDENGTIHFGYREGLSQQKIRGIHGADDDHAMLPPGDFLLGERFMNSRGGHFIGTLDPNIADHGCYAVYRVMEQNTVAFEQWLDNTAPLLLEHVPPDLGPADKLREARKLLAAKLMGRSFDGTPITQGAADDVPRGPDDFDFVDDAHGRRCPFGAHIRRLAPRKGMVVGVPWGRTVLRRGLPYGPDHSLGPADAERGLVGMFICGDIESQFEFIVKAWAKDDLSAPRLRGTMDPFAVSRSQPTPFRFHATENSPEMTVAVPPLVRTLGCLYLFMPGLQALKHMAGYGTEELQRPQPGLQPRKPPPVWPPDFGNGLHKMHRDRAERQPIVLDGQTGAYWVFSHALVQQVCMRQKEFLKTRPDGRKPGLFYLDPPNHTELRVQVDRMMQAALAGVDGTARSIAAKLLGKAGIQPGVPWDAVQGFAKELPLQVFMDVFGVRDDAVAQALGKSFRDLLLNLQAPAGTEEAKLRANALDRARATAAGLLAPATPASPTSTGAPSLLDGLRKACAAGTITLENAVATALHLGMGGFLSTEFLLTTGIHHLAKDKQARHVLKKYGAARLDHAVHEMLRIDAPFQVAERYVHAEPVELGGLKLDPYSRLIVVFGAANHDPAVFARPERFDISRPITPDNLGFGEGIHRCVGDQMGLRMARAAIQELVNFLPDELRAIEPEGWSADPYFRYLDRLELTF